MKQSRADYTCRKSTLHLVRSEAHAETIEQQTEDMYFLKQLGQLPHATTWLTVGSMKEVGQSTLYILECVEIIF